MISSLAIGMNGSNHPMHAEHQRLKSASGSWRETGGILSIITCTKCGAKNRVDESRAEAAKCGKCGAALPVVSSHPTVITDGNFSTEVLSSGAVPVLVDCWATWCPPCRAIAPVIDQLAAESGGRWKIGKLDVDANQRTAAQFRIESIPTLLIFKEGKLVDTLQGAHSKPNILAALQKWV